MFVLDFLLQDIYVLPAFVFYFSACCCLLLPDSLSSPSASFIRLISSSRSMSTLTAAPTWLQSIEHVDSDNETRAGLLDFLTSVPMLLLIIIRWTLDSDAQWAAILPMMRVYILLRIIRIVSDSFIHCTSSLPTDANVQAAFSDPNDERLLGAHRIHHHASDHFGVLLFLRVHGARDGRLSRNNRSKDAPYWCCVRPSSV